MERARTGSRGDRAQAAGRPAVATLGDPVERVLALQRAAGNRATRRLLRTFNHGKRRIPDKQLDEIEAKLRADLGGAFPELSWRVSRGKDAGAIKLDKWLADEKLDYSAKNLIRYAKEQLRAKAPPEPTMPVLAQPFFSGFSAPTHYGVPSPLDVAMIDESSLEAEDWPKLPAAVADPKLPAWDEAAFLAAFSEHVAALRERYMQEVEKSGGEWAYELEATTAPERRLMDLAWVLDKINPGRTCVAAVYTGFSIRLYANAIDTELVDDALRVEAAAAEVDAGLASRAALDALLQRLADATGPRLGTGEVEGQSAFNARVEKAGRRIYKAGKEIAALRENAKPFGLQILAHAAHQADKHAEMRLIDASHIGISGAVAISKICCAKCYSAILAARVSGRATLEVQGAHWTTYATTAGWPIPHFLKEDATAMKAFLGDEAYAWYLAHPTEAANAIETKKLEVTKATRSDPYSSGEDEPVKGKRKKRKTKTNV